MHQGTKGPSTLVKEAGNIRNSLERADQAFHDLMKYVLLSKLFVQKIW